MSKDYIELLQDENTGEFYKPYATIVCKTEEDFKNIQNALEKQTWISVEDRLPEDNTRVLVYCEWECEHIALRRNNVWVGEVEVYNDDEVLAWMPLPEPYKDKN